MRHDMAGPADTRMMGIVHEAMRRDLRRFRDALTRPPFPEADQRAALGEHADWMMDFLHHHHDGEDAGLYPMVLTRNEQARELLARMDDEHKAIAPAMDGFRTAAHRWAASGSTADRDAAIASIDALEAVLLPHLEREETEMMPVVASSITQREWHAWDQRTNVKSKSLPVLAEEGNWLIDGLDPHRRRIVEAEVPAIPRYIVLYGFGPRYRRHAARRWDTRSK